MKLKLSSKLIQTYSSQKSSYAGTTVNTGMPKLLSLVIIGGLAIATLLVIIFNSKEARVQALVTDKSITVKEPPRGLFYDRNQQRLVVNGVGYYIDILKTEFDSVVKESANLIARPEIAAVENYRETATSYRGESLISPAEKILLTNNLSPQLLNAVKFIENDLREYTYPLEFAHILGYTGKVNDNDIKQGYAINDFVGKYGLEKLYQDELKGLSVKSISSEYQNTHTESLPGNSIVLTLDAQWQKWLYQITKEESDKNGTQGAAAIIINKNNGDIATLVNYPSFDPNQFSIGISAKDYQTLLNDSRQPLLNKVVGWQASPGSTFKLFVTYSLMKNNVVSRTSVVNSQGCIKLGAANFCEIDRKRLGNVNIVDAIYRSSNIYFCQNLLKYSQQLGIDNFIEDLKLFGLAQKSASPFADEIPGMIVSPKYKLDKLNERWFDGDTCNMAIGQGYTLVTPMQLAYSMAALTNGGYLYKPNLLKEVRTAAGEIKQRGQANLVRRIDISQSTKEIIELGTYKTVRDARGSAYQLSRLPQSLNLHAKTGSTEASEVINGVRLQGTHSWLALSFENNGQEYMMIIFLRFGGRSSKTLPIAEQFFHCLNGSTSSFCE
jgi:penicillin-binding protein 2